LDDVGLDMQFSQQLIVESSATGHLRNHYMLI